jgi:hypothetical protein
MKEKIVFLDRSISVLNYGMPFIWGRSLNLSFSDVDFVNLDSDPMILSINNREIIFISQSYHAQMIDFANRNKIKVINYIDAWELICYPFVSEYLVKESITQNDNNLSNLGFSSNEVISLRNQIRKSVKFWMSLTMESESLNHYDVLMAKRRFSFNLCGFHRFYRQSMEVALRGYRNQTAPANVP